MSTSQQLDLLLSSLKKVRKTGQNKWKACCPGHDDHGPSLSIAFDSDRDIVLINCHAGCDPHEVARAVNLDLKNFSPRRPAPHGKRGPKQYFFSSDVFDDTKFLFQTGFLCLKSGNKEGVLRVIERLNLLDSVYHFKTFQTPGKEWGEDHE